MRRGVKLASIAVVILVAVAAAGWLALHARDPSDFAEGARVDLANYQGPNPTGVPPVLTGADLVTRGQYLTRAADCVACHTAPGGKPFVGGRAFKLPFGTLYSTNITPDVESGIGRWGDEDFVRALHEGIRKDGEHLYPAFPYPSYALLTRSDVLAIKAYLFGLKPVRNVPPANDLSFPFNQRYLMVLRNLLQGLSSNRKFAGTVIEGWKAYNITPDPAWGIGDWSDSQLADYLSTGHAPGRSSAAGPMGEAVDDSLRFLVKEDISALTAYLKSVPPIDDGKDIAAVRTPTAQIAAAKPSNPASNGPTLGLHTFEGACVSCHSFDGGGTVWAHAALAGNRSVNDPEAVNLTQVLFQGAHLHTPDGPVFMPTFGEGYSDAEIAAVANYLTGRFGTSASAVTPDAVAKRRQGN
jgi:mono/diheme cytochrome c family protein